MKLPKLIKHGTREYRIKSTSNPRYFNYDFRTKKRFGWTNWTESGNNYEGMEAVERAAKVHARNGVVKELGVLPTVQYIPIDASTGQPVPSLAD